MGSQQFEKCYRNDLITSIVVVRRPFGPLQVVPWDLSHSIKREKTGQNLLSPEEILLLEKFASRLLYVLKNLSFSGLHNTSQITFWTHIKMFYDYCHVRYYEKKGQITFFQWNFCLFSQNFSISTTSQVLKNAPLGSTVNVKKASGPLQFVPWALPHSIRRGKSGQKICQRENLFFQLFVSIDILGPKELILLLPQ